MSADSSSDEESCEFTKSQVYDVHSQIYDPQSQVKCWECGKKTKNLTSLMEHYKSHNIKATCHICQITFRRLISLSTHLDNAHSPPLCKVCDQVFSSKWELNKHAETHYVNTESFQEDSPLNFAVTPTELNSEDLSDEIAMKRNTNSPSSEEMSESEAEEHPENSEHDVEFVVGDEEDTDMDVDCDRASSSESEEEVKTRFKHESSDLDDSEDAGSDSSSSDSSSDSSFEPPSQKSAASSFNNTVCTACGRGPFRSIRLHLLHCNGVKKEYRCLLCKVVFQSEWSFKRHLMYLFTCQMCSQVFSHQGVWDVHPCPKGNGSPLVSFCSEVMPKVCKICKSFFTSDKTLSAHINTVHMSVVSTKVCIVTDLSLLTDQKVSAGVQNAGDQSVNGKIRASQICAGSASAPVKSSSSSSHPDTPPVPVCLISRAAHVEADLGDAPVSPTNRSPTSAAPPSCDATVLDPTCPPPPPASILAMFENDNFASRKRNASWRSKASYPCRQCGAVLRQPSLVIVHRYLHRGKRSHQCQCGRAFKHRLHLLRHCVQHAEAVSYICVSCGDTFTGAKLLARHLRGESLKKPCRKRKSKAKKTCRMTFTCDCGLHFFRPSAYIWHQLKNRTKQ